MDVTHQIPSGLKYTKSHEWLRLEGDGSVTVGITHHAQHLLGDVVYVELPSIDKLVTTGGETAVVESVKAASDVYSPLNGKIMAVNQALSSEPQLINESPYESGWIFRIQLDNAKDWESHENLLSPEDYLNSIESEG